MKLYEYMGKELFAKYGITTPKGKVALTPAEAIQIASEIVGGPSVIKSQILSGKRGKGGGIKFSDDAAGAGEGAKAILGMNLNGFIVDTVLVEEKLKIEKEYYLAITVDRKLKKPIILASIHGGMDIEDVPEDGIVKYYVDYSIGVMPFVAKDVVRQMGLSVSSVEGKQIADILVKLYKCFVGSDAELVEINPLVVSGDKIIAADAKVTIDDDALFRHKDLPHVEERTDSEKKARDLGLAFVDLDGDIGVMANGAGITMATLDTLQYYGGRAANFLDAGGGAGIEATGKALELILSKNPKAIIINIFGGITRCDDVASAFAAVKKQMEIKVPVVIRLVGTNQEKGRAILKEVGIDAYDTMHEAAQKAVEFAKQA